MAVFGNEPTQPDDEYKPVETPAGDPGHIVEQKPVVPLVPEQGNYDSLVLDDHYQDLRLFMSRMDGTNYVTQFYHNLLGSADTPEAFDPEADNHSHQLRYIRNYQMRLQGDISFSKDTTSNTVEISGTANLYPGFTPNKYDIFTGEAGEGRDYLFQINEVNELSPRKDRVVNIAFSVVGVLTPEIKQALTACVVEEQIFTKEFVSENGFLSTSKLPLMRRIKELGASGWNLFYDLFYYPDQRTFLYEAIDGTRTYDAFLNRFVLAIRPDWFTTTLREVKEFYCGEGNESINTLWSLLLDANRTRWSVLNRELVPLSCHDIPLNWDREHIGFSQVDKFMYPVDENNTLLTERRESKVKLMSFRTPAMPMPPEEPSERDVTLKYLSGEPNKSPDLDHYYVLSGAFYQDVPDLYSNLEKLVAAFLNREPVNPELLLAELEYLLGTDDLLTKYYHLPICLLLCKTVVDFDRL